MLAWSNPGVRVGSSKKWVCKMLPQEAIEEYKKLYEKRLILINTPHFPSISLGYNKGMKPVCIESTLDIPVGNDLVRIWHEQVTLKDEYLSDRKLSKLVTMVFRKKKLSVQEKIDTVAYFEPNISAIQYVKNHRRPGSKYGVVVYLKDFNTDIHG